MFRTRHTAKIAAVLALAGCGGSGSSSMTDTDDVMAAESYSEAVDQFTTTRDEVLGMTDTPGPDLPDGGSARYTGVTEVFNQFGIGVIGTAAIDVTFGPLSTVTGEASNFYQSNNVPVEGSLEISNGSAIGSDNVQPFPPTISADIEGSLRGTDGTLWQVDEARLNGTFYGDDGFAISMQGDATVAINGDAFPGEVFIYATQ